MAEYIDASTIVLAALVIASFWDKALRAVLLLAAGVAGTYFLLATSYYG